MSADGSALPEAATGRGGEEDGRAEQLREYLISLLLGIFVAMSIQRCMDDWFSADQFTREQLQWAAERVSTEAWERYDSSCKDLPPEETIVAQKPRKEFGEEYWYWDELSALQFSRLGEYTGPGDVAAAVCPIPWGAPAPNHFNYTEAELVTIRTGDRVVLGQIAAASGLSVSPDADRIDIELKLLRKREAIRKQYWLPDCVYRDQILQELRAAREARWRCSLALVLFLLVQPWHLYRALTRHLKPKHRKTPREEELVPARSRLTLTIIVILVFFGTLVTGPVPWGWLGGLIPAIVFLLILCMIALVAYVVGRRFGRGTAVVRWVSAAADVCHAVLGRLPPLGPFLAYSTMLAGFAVASLSLGAMSFGTAFTRSLKIPLYAFLFAWCLFDIIALRNTWRRAASGLDRYVVSRLHWHSYQLRWLLVDAAGLVWVSALTSGGEKAAWEGLAAPAAEIYLIVFLLVVGVVFLFAELIEPQEPFSPRQEAAPDEAT